MTEERLEVFDENNNPVGKAESRAIIHSTGLWHRTVHIYVYRSTGDSLEYLMHLRSEDKDTDPGKWDARFGGHIKEGESLEEAVVGEVKEEIGLQVYISDLIEGNWRKRDKNPNREFTKVFYLNYDRELDDLTFDDGEVQEVKWMKDNDILESMRNNPQGWSGGPEGFTEIDDFLVNHLSH